jgi:hypothetical protein
MLAAVAQLGSDKDLAHVGEAAGNFAKSKQHCGHAVCGGDYLLAR